MATAKAIPSNANTEHRSLPQETPPEELVLFVELLAANVIFAVYITAMGVVFCSTYAPMERSLSTPRLEYNREPVGDSSLCRRRCISQRRQCSKDGQMFRSLIPGPRKENPCFGA